MARKKLLKILLSVGVVLAIFIFAMSIDRGRSILQAMSILADRSYCLNGVNLTLDPNLVIDQVAKAGESHARLYGIFPVSRDTSSAPLDRNSIHIRQMQGGGVFLIQYGTAGVNWDAMLESCKANPNCKEDVSPFSVAGEPVLKIRSGNSEWYQYKTPNLLIGAVAMPNDSTVRQLRVSAKICD